MGTHRTRLLLLMNSLAIGGAERHTIALAGELAASFDVTVATLKAVPAGAASIPVPAGVRSACVDVRRRFDLQAAQRLARLVEETGADVLACVNTYPLLYAHWARWLSRAAARPRIVQIFHTTALWTWKGRAELAFYWPLFRLSDELVFLCDAQRRHWQARGLRGRRICTIYNGVDTARFDRDGFESEGRALRRRLGWSEEDRVVGLTAVLRPEKAHGLLLHAVARQAQEGRPWKVLLVGDGPLRASIEAQVRALGLEQQVHITGMLADVRPALAACDVAALVSVSETFSMSVLEAMAMSLPVVMSDVGGAREQVSDGEEGWLFPAGDTAALGAALGRCWDREASRRMGAAARRKVVARFSQADMVSAYRALLAAPAQDDGIDGRSLARRSG
jgi:glycosyltransferase involved in cell wall biosynthesis